MTFAAPRGPIPGRKISLQTLSDKVIKIQNNNYPRHATARINRLRIIHEYYQSNPGCTIHNAITFIPETKAMVSQYSKIRNECLRAMSGSN
jgi:hypothetical protein